LKLIKRMVKPRPKFDLKVGRRKLPPTQKGKRRLENILKNWDWYAQKQHILMRSPSFVRNGWNPKLKDVQIVAEYPSYILDYEKELQTAKKWYLLNQTKKI
jgi:hypothetical protein